MERNNDDKIVVLDKDMFSALLAYAEIGSREAGEHYLSKSVAQIKKHVAHFNVHQRPVLSQERREARLYHEQRRRNAKKAARLSSQWETVRYMVDHQHQVIFPIKIIGQSKLGHYRFKYESLCDGWKGEAPIDYIFETREELPANYRVIEKGEQVE